jgi:GT2 family glycosyltransferase
VVVPTVGRPESLAEVIADLRAASVDFDRVVVVADGVPAASVERLALEELAGDGVSVLDLPERSGAAAARNAAVATVAGGILCFLDDDVRLAPGWAEALRDALDAGWECFTGPVTSTERGLLAVARADRYRRRYTGLGAGDAVDFLAGGNGVISVELFRRAGEFPLIRTGSDSALLTGVRSAGGECRFAPGLVVLHTHDRGWGIALGNAWRSGRLATRASLAHERRSLLRNVQSQSLRVRLVNLIFLMAKGAGRLAAVSRRAEAR